MSTEDKEIKKRLLKADEEVEDKIAKEGGDAEAIKKGIDAKKGTNGEQAEEKNVEDIDDDEIMLMKIPQIPHSRYKKRYQI